MEYLKHTFSDLWDFYLDALSRADKRVADWPLMSAYWPTLALTGIYLLIVYFGPKVMSNQRPFTFQWTLFYYNMLMVMMNFHIFSEIVGAAWRRGYSLSCQPVDYTDNPEEVRIARAIWWYYFSKCVEFLDTIFFILRKKENQITFLHVYHHATMFPLWWIGTKWVPGGQSAFGAMINSFTHVLMYTYYGVSALGPELQKYLWWKKYLTTFQLVQFVTGVFHSAQAIYFQCDFPVSLHWAVIIYGISILTLFLNFYFQAYIRPSKTKKESTVKKPTDLNGHPKTTSAFPLVSQNGHKKQL